MKIALPEADRLICVIEAAQTNIFDTMLSVEAQT